MTTRPSTPPAVNQRLEPLLHRLQAQFGVVYVPTPEEKRVVDLLGQWSREKGRSLYRWTCTSGLVDHASETAGEVDEDTRQPEAALEEVLRADLNERSLFVFCDLHAYFEGYPEVVRLLRDCAQRLRGAKSMLVLLSPRLELPDDLEKDLAVVDFPLPTREELAEMVQASLELYGENPNRGDIDASAELREEVIQACAGLTEAEAEDALAKALIQCDGFNGEVVDSVNETKREMIRKSGALEIIDVDYSLDDVGGLDRLKSWVRKRKAAFSEEARAFGIEAPKGVLTMGVPGTGKGLSAKAVAREWRLPLLRLDMGSVFGSLVGESEANLREALQIAEAIAPVLLQVDELEKALGGAGGASTDGGTTQRVFGSFLTWLQENEAPVFVYFTANDISRLPPELLRKGRVDELFFLDLPNQEARREILAIHLRKRDRAPERFDLDRLSEACHGFVGAEIEQGIKEALIEAFDAPSGRRQLREEHIVGVFERTVPLVKTQRENLEQLFRFVREGRAQRASSGEPVRVEDLEF